MEEKLTDIQHLANIIVLMDKYMSRWTEYEVEEVDKKEILLFGFVKNLELIGQEALAITDEFKGKYYIPWTQLESYKEVFHWQIEAEELYQIQRDSSFSATWTKLLNLFKEVKK